MKLTDVKRERKPFRDKAAQDDVNPLKPKLPNTNADLKADEKRPAAGTA